MISTARSSSRKRPLKPILLAVSLFHLPRVNIHRVLKFLHVDWASADHGGAASALLDGLSKRSGSPGFYIHTSGTGILCFEDVSRNTFGEDSTKIYDDWDGIREVTSLPDGAPHRPVDKIVLAGPSTNGEKVKTAIVCPPTIYVSALVHVGYDCEI